MADSNGQFTISVKAGASLEITCIGYATKTVAASGQMTITLSQDNLFLDETVVVGYGTKRVATITGSVANSKKQIQDLRIVSIRLCCYVNDVMLNRLNMWLNVNPRQ